MTSVGPSSPATAAAGTLSAMPPSSSGRPPSLSAGVNGGVHDEASTRSASASGSRQLRTATYSGAEPKPPREARVDVGSGRCSSASARPRDRERGARTEPPGGARHRDDDVGTGVQARERRGIDDLQQRAAIDRGVREHRASAEEVPRVDVARIRRDRGLEVREARGRAAREEHAGDRRPGARCRNAAWREREARRRLAPEARLPEATVPAPCENRCREARLTGSGQVRARARMLTGPA